MLYKVISLNDLKVINFKSLSCIIDNNSIKINCSIIYILNNKDKNNIDISYDITKDLLSRFADCSVLYVYYNKDTKKTFITDRYSKTYNTKYTLNDLNSYSQNLTNILLIRLIVPSKSMSFLDMDILVNQYTEEFNFTSNIEYKTITKDYGYAPSKFLPKISSEKSLTLSKDDVAEIPVEVYWHDELLKEQISIYPIVTAGYINKSKVDIINGKGKVKVKPLLLDSGDTIEIKWGFKTYTNAFTTTVNII